MTDKEFITKFERQKTYFLINNTFSEKEARALELFENWIKQKLLSKNEGEVKDFNMQKNNPPTEKRKNVERVEFGKYLEEIVDEAKNILAGRDIEINCISFGDTLRQSSKCIKIFNNLNVFYRICKTWLRKGKYKGQGLILIELVMDGYKSTVFLPLLQKRDIIESHLGMAIDRETDYMERTGKYRFRLCFPFIGSPEDEYEARDIARILAEFIYITRECIHLLGVAKNMPRNYNIT